MNDVYADKHGYLWFGTYSNGLVRYNGYDYKDIWSIQGLKDNLINELYVENDENFWVSTEKLGGCKIRW